ncbi:hypothetical protein CLOM_g16857 [Closterium sp. NIES-68]|nr:hypothetical protein CLOM_g16857 [Closterium sp. NIES-68]
MGTGLTLYDSAHSPFVRPVLMTLFETGVEGFELKEIHTAKGENRTPEYLAMSPFARMRALHDNEQYLYGG